MAAEYERETAIFSDARWKHWNGYGFSNNLLGNWDNIEEQEASPDMKYPSRAAKVFEEMTEKEVQDFAKKNSMDENSVKQQLQIWTDRRRALDEIKKPSNKKKAAGIQKKKQYADNEILKFQWCLRNNRTEVRAQLAAHMEACMVHSVRRVLNYHKGRVWTREGYYVEVELDPSWVQDNLTDTAKDKIDAAAQSQNRRKSYVTLTDYDRVDDFNVTHFKAVKFINSDEFILKTITGRNFTRGSDWVKEHIPQRYVDKATTNPGTAVPIREGSTSSGVSVVPEELRISSVPIPHHNKGNDCAVMSVANALAFKGYEDAAQHVLAAPDDDLEELKKVSYRFFKQKYRAKMHYKKVHHGNFLGPNLKLEQPVIASLKAKRDRSDIRVNHYVCFVPKSNASLALDSNSDVATNLVLDSNSDFAMPICKESMDFICDAIQPGARYDGIFKAYKLVLDNVDAQVNK